MVTARIRCRNADARAVVGNTERTRRALAPHELRQATSSPRGHPQRDDGDCDGMTVARHGIMPINDLVRPRTLLLALCIGAAAGACEIDTNDDTGGDDGADDDDDDGTAESGGDDGGSCHEDCDAAKITCEGQCDDDNETCFANCQATWDDCDAGCD
jgi:hypothetical protein